MGALVALCHAFAETILLVFYGVRTTPLDLGLLLAVALAAGLMTGMVAGLAAIGIPFRNNADPLRIRQFVWTVIIGIYFLVFLRIIFYWDGARGGSKAILLAAPILLLASMAVFRRGRRALVLCCAAMSVTVTLIVLQLVYAGWHAIPQEKQGSAGLSLMLGIAVSAAALAFASKKRKTDAMEPAGKAVGIAMAGSILWITALAFLLQGRSLLLVHDGEQLARRSQSPNVLLVVLDTVRADHLDLFGYHRQTMPNLRQFATSECQVVNSMFTTAPWTLPSHASMFTGLYPSTHGAHEPFLDEDQSDIYSYPLREDVPTLAEFLRERGYRTAGIGANYGALTDTGLMRGFAYLDVVPGSSYLAGNLAWLNRLMWKESPIAGTFLRTTLPPVLAKYSNLFNRRETPYRRAREITDSAQQWLDRNGQKPFFLFLNYFDAHQPYLPLPEDDERFARRPAGNEWLDFPTARYNARRWQQADFTDEEKQFLVGQYDAQLTAIDRELDRLFDYMKGAGLFDNTVVFVTTDHGESLFERGLLDHGNALYQPEIGGFVLVKTPRTSPAIKASPVMQFVDFWPTIASVLNAPIPDGLQGSPWGQGRDYALSELYCRVCGDPGPWPDSFRRELVAVVVDDQKLIRSTREPDEFYDLAVDLHEMNPLPNAGPAFSERYETVIAARNARRARAVASVEPADAESMERMRSLGYVQ
jgi:arylsulfatase A-like enzyme